MTMAAMQIAEKKVWARAQPLASAKDSVRSDPTGR